MRLLFIIIGICSVLLTCDAQTDQPIDAYRLLAASYETKSTDEIRKVYTQNAALLNLYTQSEPHSITGLEEIDNYYANFFKGFLMQRQHLTLNFKIISRKSFEDKIYDSGYYELIITNPDGSLQKFYGKFNTILVNEMGRWMFFNDCTTDNVDLEEYSRAQARFSY
jgi:hypothetical protein